MAQAELGGNGRAQRYGDLVEEWACKSLFLQYHDETYYDAATHRGTPVQIKGAMKWVQNGYGSDGNPVRCRGRFKFHEGDHDTLVDEDGVYLLVVYEDTDDGIEVCQCGYFRPTDIEAVVDGDWYSESDPRERTKGLVYRTTWPSFFDTGGDDE